MGALPTTTEAQPPERTARRTPWPRPADAQPPTKTEGGPRLPYLPGLDGLRAIAVIAVFLYHAQVGWAPGGFLGVDVFFVLSGYLITSLLLAEREFAHGLRDFWIRRARRLLPAVLLVIATTLIVTSLFLRGDLGRTRGDAISSIFYVTNWHLVLGHHSYFEAFARPSLLQHLWSLAVEEQFYLVWPLALTAGLLWLGRRRFAGFVVLGAIVLSTLEMALLYKTGTDPSRVYYGTDTRAAPLLIGALLAFGWSPRRLRPDVAPGAGMVLDAVGAAALLGLIAIMVSVHDFDSGLYRGGLSAIALLAAIVVAALAHPAGRLSRTIGSRWMRWIGVRSYGIYLWHWPVIALTRPNIDVPGGPITVILQAAVTVALAAASYRWVERPIRTGEAGRRLRAWLDAREPRRRLAWVGGTATVVLALVVWSFAAPAGAPSTPGQASASTAGARAVLHAHTVAHSDPLNGISRAQLARSNVLALGDSVMLGAATALEQAIGPQRTRVDAAVGRQIDDLIARVDAYRAAGELPPRVAVQVGNNGPIQTSDLQRLRQALRGVPRVVLITVRVPRSWQDSNNQAIEQFVSTWPQAVLADWYAHSGQYGLLYDGAHPDPQGQAIYARVVADALKVKV